MITEQQITDSWSNARFGRVKVNLLDLKRELVQAGQQYGKHQFVIPTLYRITR